MELVRESVAARLVRAPNRSVHRYHTILTVSVVFPTASSFVVCVRMIRGINRTFWIRLLLLSGHNKVLSLSRQVSLCLNY